MLQPESPGLPPPPGTKTLAQIADGRPLLKNFCLSHFYLFFLMCRGREKRGGAVIPAQTGGMSRGDSPHPQTDEDFYSCDEDGGWRPSSRPSTTSSRPSTRGSSSEKATVRFFGEEPAATRPPPTAPSEESRDFESPGWLLSPLLGTHATMGDMPPLPGVLARGVPETSADLFGSAANSQGAGSAFVGGVSKRHDAWKERRRHLPETPTSESTPGKPGEREREGRADGHSHPKWDRREDSAQSQDSYKSARASSGKAGSSDEASSAAGVSLYPDPVHA